MAKATTFTRTIRKVVKTTTPYCVELNLTPEEAGVLFDVLNRITGSDTNSPRKHTEAIRNALSLADVVPSPHCKTKQDVCTIWYADYPT